MVRSVRTTLSGCRDMTPNVMPAMSPSSRLARPWCMSGTVVYVVCEVYPLTPPAKAIAPAVTGVIESILGHMVHCHSSGRVALSVSPARSDGTPPVDLVCGRTSLVHIAPRTSLPSHGSTLHSFPTLCDANEAIWVLTRRCDQGCTHECAHTQAVGPCRRDTQSDPSRAVTVHHVAYNALNDTCDS